MFPTVQLVAGLAFICSAKVAPGRVSHQCYGHINFGNYSCHDTARLDTVVAHFNAAGVKAGLVEYEEARWKKAVWNMPFNGMTVALNTQTDLLLGNPYTRQLIRAQMMEVVTAAQHLGVENIGEDFVQDMMDMTDAMTPYSPSMKLDYDFLRPMEISYLYTKPIQQARAAGFSMPKLEMLEAQLRFREAMHINKKR
jgi:2-dehydropantoate 2-reductase